MWMMQGNVELSVHCPMIPIKEISSFKLGTTNAPKTAIRAKFRITKKKFVINVYLFVSIEFSVKMAHCFQLFRWLKFNIKHKRFYIKIYMMENLSAQIFLEK